MEYVCDAGGNVCHIVVRLADMDVKPRTDVVNPNQPLQVSAICALAGKKFLPHQHRRKQGIEHATQEAWVVVTGDVLVTYFDTQGNKIESNKLHQGDCSITLAGGHGYEIVSDRALVYEFKTGPYLGQEQDKHFYRDV